MTEPGAAALTGGVALLERAIGYTLAALPLVTGRELTRPTPCREWDVRALLGHLNDALCALDEAAGRRRVSPGPGTARPARDLVGELRENACRVLGGWVSMSGPAPAPVLVADRPVTAPVVAAAGAIEVAVHGWDLFRGCGSSRRIPPELAEELLDLAVVLVRESDRPHRFAPALPVPRHAPDDVRLLAYLGRVA